MVYILYGEDDFLIKESLAKIKEDCGGVELGDANTTLFDGTKITLNELVAACNTIAFLAPKRLVIVEGLLSRFEVKEKRRGRAKPELHDWGPLAEHVANMPDSTVLVLLDAKLSKTNPLLKKFDQIATITEYVPLKGMDLHYWIRSRVVATGGEISAQAIRYLIDTIGNNLWILSNEINKLCTYAGGRRIEVTDINSLVSHAKETGVFVMVDAIVQRRLGLASRLLHQLMDDGSAPSYLLYMITRQFRLLIQAKELIAQQLPDRTIGGKLGLNLGFVLEKTLEQARAYSLGRLEETYRKLLDTDLSIKTGMMEGESALDLLITDLCSKEE